jgi:hypothetical protein
MRAIVVRRLKKAIYKDEFSPRARQHFVCNKTLSRGQKNLIGCCVADERRRAYQRLKRLYLRKQFIL